MSRSRIEYQGLYVRQIFDKNCSDNFMILDSVIVMPSPEMYELEPFVDDEQKEAFGIVYYADSNRKCAPFWEDQVGQEF